MTRTPYRRGLLLGAALLAALAVGQSTRVQAPLPGYAARVSGEVLHYHSPLPDVETSLLVRSLDARRAIVWETAPIPADAGGEWVELVWMFGLQITPDRHRFELHVGDEPWFTFENPVSDEVRDWTVAGPRGSELRFRATMIDRFGDLMGYSTLRVPRAACTPGEPLRLSVVGESAGSRAWYMVFQEAVREGASISALPALVRGEDGPYQPLRLEVIHLAEPADARVVTSFGEERDVRLEPGGNQIELRHPAVQRDTPVDVRVVIAGVERHRLRSTVRPVREWHVDLVQHTHTDVGYTRPQTEILPEHLRFIDTALDYCDQTDAYPEAARFRWTCEASWAVREYLESRTPAQIERLRRRVEEGRIEVTGMFLNMSEVVDEASYAAFLAPIRAIREAGIEVSSAMQNDINGAAWCLADLAGDLGIERLTMGQHAHRALLPFDVPTCFWWESPAGNRLLAFRADHYQTGNFFGVHEGRVEPVADGLLRYLGELERAGFPFERVAVQHSGYPTDNSPPSTASSELVRAWNERYVWPRLRCSLDREFPSWVRAHHADELEVIRAAWPDWWADGFGSAPRESAAARVTQARVSAVESLLALERVLGLELPAPLAREIDEIRDALLFYGEHTFGAAESITDPFCENSVVQWAQKSAYAWDAVKRTAILGEGALGRLDTLVAPLDDAQLVVFNALNFARAGALELYVDHELLPVDRPFRIVDDAGAELAVQLSRSRAEGSYWTIGVGEVPSFGLRSWRIRIDSDGEPERPSPPRAGEVLENRFYRLRVDPRTGAVASLFDKQLERELVDADADWQLGQLVHERLGNREQLESFELTDYARSTASDVELLGVTRGPLWDALAVRAELPGCQGPGGVSWELRLFHREKRVELHFTAHKRRVFEPESIYVAFPFDLPDARLVYETLGGTVDPESAILHGAASDWQAMQSFVAARTDEVQVVLTSDEIPLIQLGAINTGRYQPVPRVERPHVYSWVMNNYWTTNFVAAPEGELRWSYALTSSRDASNSFAYRFGAASRVPFLGRVRAGGGAPGPAPARSVLPLEVPGLLLVAARPARHGDGVVLHLREVEGNSARLPVDGWRMDGRRARVHLVDVTERELAEVEDGVSFGPFESRLLRVDVERAR